MSAMKIFARKSLWTEILRPCINCCTIGRTRFISKNSESSEKVEESPLKDLLNNSATFNDVRPNDPNDVWATHPYPVILRNQMESESGVRPEDMSIILFPGQGTQYMGMGKDLVKFPRAKELFEISNEIIGIDLLNIKTPKELTKYSQELIVTCSLAALEKLREERPSALFSCVATAGFSLGEITALIFAGSIPFEQGLRLVTVRAAAMEAASKERPGGMLTIIYTPEANIKRVCIDAKQYCLDQGQEQAFCSVANYLYPSCKVISGCEEALKYIENNASKLGIRKTKRVNVSGAFHSEAVSAAVAPFTEALRLCQVDKPQVRVLSGVDGKQYHNVNHIRSQLPKQIIKPVRWEQLIHNLYERPKDMKFPRTFEVGPGYTLRTLLRKVNAKAWDSSMSVLA